MNLKKIILLALVALAIYLLVINPTGAAGGVQSVLNWLKEGAQAIITFVQRLFQG